MEANNDNGEMLNEQLARIKEVLASVPVPDFVGLSPDPLPASRSPVIYKPSLHSIDTVIASGIRKWVFRYTDGMTTTVYDANLAERMARELFPHGPPANQ